MIIVRVVGGLANQMGGYAAAYGLARQYDVPLKIDVGQLQKDKVRKFDLDKLHVPVAIATEEEIRAISHQSRLRIINRLKKSIYKRLGKTSPHIYREKSLQFDPGFFKIPPSVYVVGDFPSVKYYSDIFPALKEIYRVKAALSPETLVWLRRISQCTHPVALHVRRTDYVNNPATMAVHGSISLAYYEKAIAYLQQNLANPEFFVFSDDPEWARQNIRAVAPVHYVDCNDAANGYQDFHLMKQCRHYIMANSGFSRWAALLSENDSGIVIRPTRWTVDDLLQDGDIGPDTWIKM